MKASQLVVVGGLVVGAACVPQVAAAAPIPNGCAAPGVRLTNSAILDFGSWKWMRDGCEQENLIYKYLDSSDALDKNYVSTYVTPDNPGVGLDTHRINFSIWPTTENVSYMIKYSVEVDLVDVPHGILTEAWLSKDVSHGDPAGTSTFTSEYYRDAAMTQLLGSVASVDSNTESMHTAVVYGLTKLWIVDTYVLTGNAITNSATDYLIMGEVPAPATLVLFAAGLAGLGTGVYRRKAGRPNRTDARRYCA